MNRQEVKENWRGFSKKKSLLPCLDKAVFVYIKLRNGTKAKLHIIFVPALSMYIGKLVHWCHDHFTFCFRRDASQRHDALSPLHWVWPDPLPDGRRPRHPIRQEEEQRQQQQLREQRQKESFRGQFGQSSGREAKVTLRTFHRSYSYWLQKKMAGKKLAENLQSRCRNSAIDCRKIMPVKMRGSLQSTRINCAIDCRKNLPGKRLVSNLLFYGIFSIFFRRKKTFYAPFPHRKQRR